MWPQNAMALVFVSNMSSRGPFWASFSTKNIKQQGEIMVRVPAVLSVSVFVFVCVYFFVFGGGSF